MALNVQANRLKKFLKNNLFQRDSFSELDAFNDAIERDNNFSYLFIISGTGSTLVLY